MALADASIKTSSKMTDKYEKGIVNRITNQFMKGIKDFLQKKAGGEIPIEWGLSLTLLETYYRQFIAVSRELERTNEYMLEGKRGPVPNALLQIQAHAATRLEKAMSELGLSLKSSKKLGITEPKKDESALDAFFKTTMGDDDEDDE